MSTLKTFFGSLQKSFLKSKCHILQAYLMVGYAGNLTSTLYVVTWTTSHSVLTLKLIGIAWDVYDGGQKVKSRCLVLVDRYPLFTVFYTIIAAHFITKLLYSRLASK